MTVPNNPSGESGNLYLPQYVGKFLRYDFSLPTGYYDLAFSFEASVNDEYALYINDTVVAIQADTTSTNFASPLPGFSLSTTGTAVDTSAKLEYLLSSGMQSLFQAGNNELTLYGTDTLQYGGFVSVSGEISYTVDEQNPTIPVPSAVWLVGSGLVGLVAKRWRFNQ